MWIEPYVYQHIKRQECCGCEACENICPVDAIQMQADKEGFLYPMIESEKCIHCNKCVTVCPQLIKERPKVNMEMKAYGGFSKDSNIVNTSSSGGAFSVLANEFLQKFENGKVAAVIWENDFKSTVHIVGDQEHIPAMKRSKYIQSRKGNIYRKVKELLDKKIEVLFIGCPCEVAGMRYYLGKDYPNLWLIDLVCQGPTSPQIMKDYVELVERKYKSKITDLNLRYNGGKTWIPQWINIKFENGRTYKRVFYETELGIAVHFMQRPSCYQCQWNGQRRMSDLTLGDYHGADSAKKYYNAAGTSVIILNTKKGHELYEICQPKMYLEEVSYDQVAKYNPRIERTWDPLPGTDIFIKTYIEKGLKSAAFESLSLRKKMRYLLPVKFSDWINR